MSKLTISPSKISEFDIKIAKDGILRSSNEILAQNGVDMIKIRKIFFLQPKNKKILVVHVKCCCFSFQNTCKRF